MENTHQSEGLRAFFTKIYTKMAMGVLLTALVSFAMVYTAPGNQLFETIFSSKIIYYGIIGIELALLIGIQWGMSKLSKKWAEILFYVYAAISGLTLSVILVAYTGATLVSTFIGAVAIFGALALLGQKMKYDMSGWKVFLFTGMWGVFIVSIINGFFVQSSRMDWIVTIVGVLVFAGLTVYQNQSYKRMYLASTEGESLGKMIALGALHMYINFIMIFVNLLKIMGSRD